MACFLACFGSSTHNKKTRKEKEAPPQPLHLNKYHEPDIKLIPFQYSKHQDADREQDKEEKEVEKEDEKEEEEEIGKYEEGVKPEGSLGWRDSNESVEPKSRITLVESRGRIGGRSRCVSAVMCPVGSITQWNAVKSQDENNIEEGEEEGREMSTSLSAWLSSGGESTEGMISCKCNGEEEARQFSSSADCTPIIRQIPSPVEHIPVLRRRGGDGAEDYHSPFKGIPNTTTKYREDQKVKWHTTPFEMRLERALKTGFAEA